MAAFHALREGGAAAGTQPQRLTRRSSRASQMCTTVQCGEQFEMAAVSVGADARLAPNSAAHGATPTARPVVAARSPRVTLTQSTPASVAAEAASNRSAIWPPDRFRLHVAPPRGRPAVAVAVLAEPHSVAFPFGRAIAAGTGAYAVALKRCNARQRLRTRWAAADERDDHDDYHRARRVHRFARFVSAISFTSRMRINFLGHG
jgi:hypothetical protein